MNVAELTIKEINKGLKEKDFSAEELTKLFLKNIDKKDKKIEAFLTRTSDSAKKQAKEIDEMISGGRELPLLAGVPFAVKDNILVKGVRCTAASKILEDYKAPYEATVIGKLKEKKGIILGKTNLDEFAMGSSTENSAFGVTKNPHDLNRVPGGSSGGSAAAVASGQCCYALGSDTGGSIRQPASFCGVVGFKPTYGAVSRYGLIAFGSSLDQIGPLTKTVEDAQIVFEAISGKDNFDSTSVEKRKETSSLKNFKDLKIGVPKEYFVEGINPEVEKIIKGNINKFEKKGAKIKEISLPHTKYALAVYYIIAPSEASANLARYDGIKYGYSAKKAKNLLDFYLKTRGEGFGIEVKRRIMLGTYSLSSGYYDAYYLRAQKVRKMIKDDFEKAFREVDFIFTPTSPSLAFKIGEKINDPLSMYLADIFTVPVNLAELPAISLPAGKVNDLPVGLQIIGNNFEEDKIFEAAKLVEKIV